MKGSHHSFCSSQRFSGQRNVWRGAMGLGQRGREWGFGGWNADSLSKRRRKTLVGIRGHFAPYGPQVGRHAAHWVHSLAGWRWDPPCECWWWGAERQSNSSLERGFQNSGEPSGSFIISPSHPGILIPASGCPTPPLTPLFSSHHTSVFEHARDFTRPAGLLLDSSHTRQTVSPTVDLPRSHA